jgi:nucleoside-diphosphate-sugar epimerase
MKILMTGGAGFLGARLAHTIDARAVKMLVKLKAKSSKWWSGLTKMEQMRHPMAPFLLMCVNVHQRNLQITSKQLIFMVGAAGFEPATSTV